MNLLVINHNLRLATFSIQYLFLQRRYNVIGMSPCCFLMSLATSRAGFHSHSVRVSLDVA